MGKEKEEEEEAVEEEEEEDEKEEEDQDPPGLCGTRPALVLPPGPVLPASFSPGHLNAKEMRLQSSMLMRE